VSDSSEPRSVVDRLRVPWLVGAALATALLFALVTAGVLAGNPVQRWDGDIHRFVFDHRGARTIDVLRVATELGGGSVATPVVAVTAAVLLLVRRWTLAVFVVLASVGTELLVLLGKNLVDRPRPDAAGRLAGAGGLSFPSGHSAQGLALWFALAIVVVAVWRARIPPWIAFGLAAAIAFVVGLSRVVLGVHWSTDVIGGWLLAATWLLVLVTSWTMWMGRRRASSVTTEDPPA
jgi:undecaprenyl-diphosphatase